MFKKILKFISNNILSKKYTLTSIFVFWSFFCNFLVFIIYNSYTANRFSIDESNNLFLTITMFKLLFENIFILKYLIFILASPLLIMILANIIPIYNVIKKNYSTLKEDIFILLASLASSSFLVYCGVLLLDIQKTDILLKTFRADYFYYLFIISISSILILFVYLLSVLFIKISIKQGSIKAIKVIFVIVFLFILLVSLFRDSLEKSNYYFNKSNIDITSHCINPDNNKLYLVVSYSNQELHGYYITYNIENDEKSNFGYAFLYGAGGLNSEIFSKEVYTDQKAFDEVVQKNCKVINQIQNFDIWSQEATNHTVSEILMKSIDVIGDKNEYYVKYMLENDLLPNKIKY